MKFMVSWCVHEDKRHEAFKVFSGMNDAEIEQEFGNLNVIGRWHDLVGFTGVAIVETEDQSDLATWLLQWNAMCDIETIPVFNDREAREIGRRTIV